MDFRRTPDARFDRIPDFDYAPRYVDVSAGDGSSSTLRMAFVDEGPRDARTVLMLHGEPSWGFLYRKVARVCREAGLRVVIPDLVGFGRSDKPTQREDYTYARHIAWTKALPARRHGALRRRRAAHPRRGPTRHRLHLEELERR